jgi:hypothetical protein
MSFPSELNLGSNKPMSASGKPSINRYRSDNSTYQGSDVVRIEVPTGRKGQMLFPKDSFLELKIRINATNGLTANSSIYLDQSIYSIFSRMRIFHGSNVVEDTLYCNKLWTSIFDLQINEVKRRGESITKLVWDNTTTVAGALATPSIFNSGLFGIPFARIGVNVAATDYPLVNAVVTPYDACFCIPSALLGSLASKALPLGLMGASSIYLELELAPALIAFIGDGTATINSYTVSDIFYNAKITTLPSDIDDLLMQSTGGIVNLPAISYKTEAKTISAASSSFNDKFSFQYSSLKNFLFFVQNSATANGVLANRSVTSRPKANIQDYFLTINGEAYPSQTIQGTSRMYSELMRAFDGLSDTGFGGIINYYNYTQNQHTANGDALTGGAVGDGGTTTVQKRFLAGIDLDRFNHSSDTLLSGSSSIGQMINLNLNFSAPTTDVLVLYAAVQYDVLFHIQDGLLMAKI